MWVAVLAAGMLAGSALMGTAGAAPAGPPDGLDVREQNVDENVDGAIRVHEQGIADVLVTNASLDANVTFPDSQTVDGTVGATQDGLWSVGVNNFPTTQEVSGAVEATITGTPDVNVVSMPSVTYSPAPATDGFSEKFILDKSDPPESITLDPVFNASTIIIASNQEIRIIIYGSVGGSIDLGDANDDFGRMAISLVQPYPVSSIWVSCLDEGIGNCVIDVTLIGSTAG
jgi:hypothetical protein